MSGINFQGYGQFNNPTAFNLDNMTMSEFEGLTVLDDYGDIFDDKVDENPCCPGYTPPSDNDKYCGSILIAIQLMYILASILWICFIYVCGLYRNFDTLIAILLAIPILVFMLGYYNACNVTLAIESNMLQSNYLSFGFLITIILLNWNSPLETKNKNKFFKLLISAFILIMLSMIDIWTDREHLSFVVHFKSILQTGALVILSVALYSYYRAHVKSTDETPDFPLEWTPTPVPK